MINYDSLDNGKKQDLKISLSNMPHHLVGKITFFVLLKV
jgi:hypothetical protein